ncbi:MAG: hypothetical protein M0P17_13520 [Methanoculleus sp.]|nr:hypothetical protein [Methanoculleus sp.]
MTEVTGQFLPGLKVGVSLPNSDEEKGFTRDEISVQVFIPAGETKRVSLTLDGDVGRTYRHSVEVG